MTPSYYPRLPDSAATELLIEYTGVPASELRDRSAAEHRAMTYYPTATRRVTPEALIELRDAVRDAATACGYPQPVPRRSPQLRNLDQTLSPLLLARMDIVPADAASDGVWSFLSLVLMPDVAFWRFPNQDRREDYERLIGRPRNVFRRLWWRAFALGPEVSSRLLEDEAVAILERGAIGGDPIVAKTIAEVHLSTVDADPSLPRTELLRDAMKRVRRMAAFISLGGLDEAGLKDLLAEVFRAASQQVTSHRWDGQQAGMH